MPWGIAFTDDGMPDGRVVGWKETWWGSGIDLVFDDRDDALKSLDAAGWTGYVREYVKVAEESIRSRSGLGERLVQGMI